MLLANIGLQLANPQIIRYFIDSATSGVSADALLVAAALFIAIAIGTQALYVLARYLAEQVGWTATNALREDLTTHCLGLDLSFHHSHTPGELTQRVDADVTPLAEFFSQFVVLVVGNVLLLTGVVVALFFVDWRAGLTYGVLGAITALTLIGVQNKATDAQEAHAKNKADLFGFLEERVTAEEEIRTSSAVTYVMRRFHERLRSTYQSHRRSLLVGGLTWSVADFIWGISTAIALGLGAFLVLL